MRRPKREGAMPCLLLGMLFFVVGIDDVDRPWDGDIRQWGTMREVLRDGQTQARVRLAEAVSRSHAYGVGALAGLAGEVTVVDGKVWLARAEGDACKTTAPDKCDDSAALLAVAYVSQWRKTEITREIADADLASFLHSTAQSQRIATDKPFPFLIQGSLDVDGHVINGSCPMASAGSSTAPEPFRFAELNRRGTAVGFYAEGAEGSLTHHGQLTHIHVVFDDEPLLSGHAEQLHVHAGAVLYLPSAHE